MSFVQLEDVGKIYVSGASVAVGIRHVNLSFDIGEFVAVTGKSGSGKTTLLNVISGMDTYEEGELYVQGEPTSHFSQADWELYRQQYISFVFQEYNIIESFTVLQNVELALSHMPDKKQRRARALELIERVGLTPFKKHKGARLSGGQKQRTVIARALAKESPVILADEPTGNLDSKSSEEIIALLAEIAKEKLVIVVTHSFAQLEAYATREIRIFDGGVERDTVLRPHEKKELPPVKEEQKPRRVLRRSAELGWHRFFAAPKLSAFMCVLMILAMLGSFFVTAFCVNDLQRPGESQMFQYLPGRVVVVRQDGTPLSDEELSLLQSNMGAVSALHYDALLDHGTAIRYHDFENWRHYSVSLCFTNDASITPDIGRRPAAADEALLELPIEFQPVYGKDTLLRELVALYDGAIMLKVVGVSYYYDNTRPNGSVVLTQEGFEALSAADYLCGGDWRTQCSFSLDYTVLSTGGVPSYHNLTFKNVVIDNTLHGRTVATNAKNQKLVDALRDAAAYNLDLNFTLSEENNYDGKHTIRRYAATAITQDTEKRRVQRFDDGLVTFEQGITDSLDMDISVSYGGDVLAISPELARELMLATRNDSYTQASLFFANDTAAKAALAPLRAAGYVGVHSAATYADAESLLGTALENGLLLFVWILLICFLSVFVALCSTRAMSAKKGDLAILRSMGIPVSVVKLSSYVQTLLSVPPSILVVTGVALLCYLHPRINPSIPFLHAPQYALMLLGLLLICTLVTYWHNRRMFRDSVRKTLKGGESK